MEKVVEREERTFPYRVEVEVRGLAPTFLREAWGYQEQAMRESARLGAGFPDSRALCIPLVSKFPPSSASAGERAGLSSACQRHWGLGKALEPGKCGEERIVGET